MKLLSVAMAALAICSAAHGGQVRLEWYEHTPKTD